MKDFEIKHHSGYSIITITAANAKFQEAIEFKSLADEEIEKGFNNIIISLNECELIDSAFIGVLVVIWRKLKIRGGSLKLVKIGSFNHSVLHLSGVIEIFERYDSIEKAIDSFITPVPQFH